MEDMGVVILNLVDILAAKNLLNEVSNFDIEDIYQLALQHNYVYLADDIQHNINERNTNCT